LIGNEKLIQRYDVDLSHNRLSTNLKELEQTGKTVVILCIDKTARLLISMEEEHLAKPESQAIVKYLREELHLKVAMITGDNEHTALKVANHVGIDPKLVTARAYPHQKRNVVKRLQK